MSDDLLSKLGPLAGLAGTWEGFKGDDIAPDDNPAEIENNKFREELIFEPFGPVDNHAQQLFGLRYSLTAWRLDADSPFHEDRGYWLWDPKEQQVMRCFVVPRGVAVIAGGTVSPDARGFFIAADCGSETYGICSNKFLDREFKTVRFEMTVTIHDSNSFSYEQDTQLRIPGQAGLFHHTDRNTVTRVG